MAQPSGRILVTLAGLLLRLLTLLLSLLLLLTPLLALLLLCRQNSRK